MTTHTLTFSEEQIATLFGHEAAEDEDPRRLKEYYFRSAAYKQVAADLPLRILVGHKGIGKSALFQVAVSETREDGRFAIDVRPDDVAGVGSDTKDFVERIKDWKRGLREAILSSSLRTLGSDDLELKNRAIGKGGGLVSWLADSLKPMLERYVDSSPIRKTGLENLIKQQQITVYIDDLDRGWQGRQDDIMRLSALLNATRDLTRENPGLRFRIALRSDVFYLVRTSDESTDKVQGSVIWYSWTNHEILALLVKRIETFFGRQPDESQLLRMDQRSLSTYLLPVMEERFLGEGKWKRAPMYRVLMSLIRRRPRDLVKLLTLAGRQAASSGANKIGTEHLQPIFDEYSQDRVQDTVNEYRSELPQVERLLLGMKPNRRERTTKEGYSYKTDELLKKLRNVIQSGDFVDATGRTLQPKQLANFLYKINFIVASKELPDGFIDRKYFEENRYLSSELADFGYDWEIHLAYRWALQPDARDSIYQFTALSADS